MQPQEGTSEALLPEEHINCQLLCFRIGFMNCPCFRPCGKAKGHEHHCDCFKGGHTGTQVITEVTPPVIAEVEPETTVQADPAAWDTVYSDMPRFTADLPEKWRLELLSTSNGRRVIKSLRRQIRIMLDTTTFVQVCLNSDKLTWKETKDFSKQGFTYRKGRGSDNSVDEGNYCYSVILTWCYRVAEGAARKALDVLYRNYPRLLPSPGHIPYNMWVLQGDFVECMLAVARITGTAIEAHHVEDRHKFHQAVKDFADGHDELIQYLNSRYIAVRRRIATEVFVDHILAELAVRRRQLAFGDDYDDMQEIDPECVLDDMPNATFVVDYIGASRPSGFSWTT